MLHDAASVQVSLLVENMYHTIGGHPISKLTSHDPDAG
jgi:hypothetical protein